MRVARRFPEWDAVARSPAREKATMDQQQLRALVATMQARVAAAVTPTATADEKGELTRAWDSLVNHLALGPAPDTHPCPRCGREIMRAATVCGYCWAKLDAAPAGHA
jgi:hypothetical protein